MRFLAENWKYNWKITENFDKSICQKRLLCKKNVDFQWGRQLKIKISSPTGSSLNHCSWGRVKPTLCRSMSLSKYRFIISFSKHSSFLLNVWPAGTLHQNCAVNVCMDGWIKLFDGSAVWIRKKEGDECRLLLFRFLIGWKWVIADDVEPVYMLVLASGLCRSTSDLIIIICVARGSSSGFWQLAWPLGCIRVLAMSGAGAESYLMLRA